MGDILGYDCDGQEIYEFRVLRAIWSNNMNIEEMEDADPRHYCAVIAADGNAYAISVYDWWNKDLIRQREGLEEDEDVPTIVKPISAMQDYELAECVEGEFYYTLDRDELKQRLNSIVENKNSKKHLLS